jgi:hypothetical protein
MPLAEAGAGANLEGVVSALADVLPKARPAAMMTAMARTRIVRNMSLIPLFF